MDENEGEFESAIENKYANRGVIAAKLSILANLAKEEATMSVFTKDYG